MESAPRQNGDFSCCPGRVATVVGSVVEAKRGNNLNCIQGNFEKTGSAGVLCLATVVLAVDTYSWTSA